VEFAFVMAVVAAFVLVLLFGTAVYERFQRQLNTVEVDPEKLLATRFAKGEIDEREYSRRLSILRLGPPLEIPD
jgi:uncharacterized membrane protein